MHRLLIAKKLLDKMVKQHHNMIKNVHDVDNMCTVSCSDMLIDEVKAVFFRYYIRSIEPNLHNYLMHMLTACYNTVYDDCRSLESM